MIQRGDNIFYTDNQRESTYCPIAVRIIQDLGLIPYFYKGAGLSVRNSSLDREIRDDFYNAKVVVIVLGKGNEWRNIDDNWATPELECTARFGISCLIYSSVELSLEEVKLLKLPFNPVVVKDETDFSVIFEHDLQKLMVLPS